MTALRIHNPETKYFHNLERKIKQIHFTTICNIERRLAAALTSLCPVLFSFKNFVPVTVKNRVRVRVSSRVRVRVRLRV